MVQTWGLWARMEALQSHKSSYWPVPVSAGHPHRRPVPASVSMEGPGPPTPIAQQKEITFQTYFPVIPETVQSTFTRPDCGLVFSWKNWSPIISVSEAMELIQPSKSMHCLRVSPTLVLCALSWIQAVPKPAHFISAATSEPNIKAKLNMKKWKKKREIWSNMKHF